MRFCSAHRAADRALIEMHCLGGGRSLPSSKSSHAPTGGVFSEIGTIMLHVQHPCSRLRQESEPRELNQPDLIHPNPTGHRVVADVVWKTLEPLLVGTDT